MTSSTVFDVIDDDPDAVTFEVIVDDVDTEFATSLPDALIIDAIALPAGPATHYGHGVPTGPIPGARENDYYIDLDTGIVYLIKAQETTP